MTRKPLTMAVLGLVPLCGILSGCNTVAGFGRDMSASGDWISRQTGGGESAAASGTSTAPGVTAEDQVRKNLADHGYTNPSGLHQSGDRWVGAAVDYTGKPVHVSVDPNGVITPTP